MNKADEIVFSYMRIKTNNRQFLSAVIIFFYLIPLLFFASYSISLMSPNKSWSILSLGLLLISCGSLVLILLISYWEKALKMQAQEEQLAYSRQLVFYPSEKETKVTSLDPNLVFTRNLSLSDSDALPRENLKELNLLQTALKENQEQYKALQEEFEFKNQEVFKLEEENKQLLIKAQHISQDFSDYKLFSEEQLKQKTLQLTTLQQMIEDQRSEMEKRQDQIYQLDTKVHDLSYEIKTLLYLHEEESSPKSIAKSNSKSANSYKITSNVPFSAKAETTNDVVNEAKTDENQLIREKWINSSAEAVSLLKKCIQMAQKLTGANYHSNEASRYREFSSSHYTIDQRRLFDNLRNEKASLIIMYSQKENKLLFVNNQSKTLLGWSPEKFISDFPQIFQEGINDWKRAIGTLITASESQARLLAKTRNGQEILLSCHLAVIPAGLFRNFAIGVLYPA